MLMILAGNGLISTALNMDFSRLQVRFIQCDRSYLILHTGLKCVIVFSVGSQRKKRLELFLLGQTKVVGIPRVLIFSLPMAVKIHGKSLHKRKTVSLSDKFQSLRLVILAAIAEISTLRLIKLIHLW